VTLKTWTRSFLPAWTFFLGLLIGGLPGGLTQASNYGAVGLYLLATGAVWVVIALLLRRQDARQTPTTPPTEGYSQ